MTEPLKISVEIAEHLFHDDYRTDRLSAAEVIDEHVRPLVDLLRECQPYIDDYQGMLLHRGGDECRTLLSRLNEALKANS